MSLEEIENFKSRLIDKVSKNLEIVAANEMNKPFFLHITSEKTPVYVPRIGHRQADSEDRTTARITVGTTLLGCIIGYAALPWNFMTSEVNYGTGKWLGGLYIRKIPFDHAFKPSSKLVYDQVATNEHWLVNYNPETAKYPSSQIGKFFVSKLILEGRNGKEPSNTLECFISLTEEIYWSEKVVLSPGCYCIVFPVNSNTTWKSTKDIVINQIDQNEFNEKKRLVAVLLTADSSLKKKPVYSKW